MIGKIDVHSHLLPGIDDGCKSLEESLACARVLVDNGYTHSFCTPHIWANLPRNNVANIPILVADLQSELDKHGIALKLIPGGEHNISSDLFRVLDKASVVTFGMKRRHVLVDLWADKLPDTFEPNVKRLQAIGLTVILAHPERMRAIQDDPAIVDYCRGLGMLMQGNLQCFNDAPHTYTRQTAELLLERDQYFCLGSDLHGIESLPPRMAGLKRVADAVGENKRRELTTNNPKKFLGEV